MVEQNDSGAWLGLGLGVGVIIGGFFTWVILKSGQQPAPPAQTQTMQPQYPPAYHPPPAINVYPVIRDEQKPATGIQTHVVSPEPRAVPLEITAYKNNEHWEIERSKDGAIKGINVVRDVKADVAAAG